MAESGLPYLSGSSKSYQSARSSTSAMSAVMSAMSAVDREVAWHTATVQHAFNAQLLEGGVPAQQAFRVYLQCKMQAEHEFRCQTQVGEKPAPAWCGTRSQLRRQQREAQMSREEGVPERAQHLCSENARREQKRARSAASAIGAGSRAKAESGERASGDVAAARDSCGVSGEYGSVQGCKMGDGAFRDGNVKNGTPALTPATIPSHAPAPLPPSVVDGTVSRLAAEDAGPGDTVHAHVPPPPPQPPPQRPDTPAPTPISPVPALDPGGHDRAADYGTMMRVGRPGGPTDATRLVKSGTMYLNPLKNSPAKCTRKAYPPGLARVCTVEEPTTSAQPKRLPAVRAGSLTALPPGLCGEESEVDMLAAEITGEKRDRVEGADEAATAERGRVPVPAVVAAEEATRPAAEDYPPPQPLPYLAGEVNPAAVERSPWVRAAAARRLESDPECASQHLHSLREVIDAELRQRRAEWQEERNDGMCSIMGYTWEEMEETEEEDLNHLARVVAEAWKASGPDADTSEEEESEEDADEL